VELFQKFDLVSGLRLNDIKSQHTMQDQQKTCLVGPIAIIGNGLKVEKSQNFLGYVN